MQAKLINLFIHSCSKYLLSISVPGIISNSHRVCAKGKKESCFWRSSFRFADMQTCHRQQVLRILRERSWDRRAEMCLGVPSEWGVGRIRYAGRKGLTKRRHGSGEKGQLLKSLPRQHEHPCERLCSVVCTHDPVQVRDRRILRGCWLVQLADSSSGRHQPL